MHLQTGRRRRRRVVAAGQRRFSPAGSAVPSDPQIDGAARPRPSQPHWPRRGLLLELWTVADLLQGDGAYGQGQGHGQGSSGFMVFAVPVQVHHQTTKEDPSERPTELLTYEMEMRGDREPP